MKYIDRSNRFYSLLLTLSRRQRFVATTGVMVALVLGWYLLFYQPLESRICSCQKKATEHNANTSSCADLHTQCEQLEQKINSDEQQLGKYSSTSNARDYLSTIAKLGHQATVCIENCSLEQMEEKENMRALPIMIKGHGTIAQLTEFFNKVSETYATAAPAQITIDHIKDNVFQLTMLLTILSLK